MLVNLAEDVVVSALLSHRSRLTRMRAFVDLKLDGSYHMSDKTARQYEVERVIEPDRRVNIFGWNFSQANVIGQRGSPWTIQEDRLTDVAENWE